MRTDNRLERGRMIKAKTDCFAYKPGQHTPRRKAECTALDRMYCREGECRFYKSREDVGGELNEKETD